MEKLKVAIGSNDGKSINKGHMGESKYFYIYEVYDNGNFREIDKRINNTPEEKKHADENKRNKAIEIFKDCDVIVGKMLSPNFLKIAENTKYQPVVINRNSIKDIMDELHKIFNDIQEKVERRRKGETFKEVPMIR